MGKWSGIKFLRMLLKPWCRRRREPSLTFREMCRVCGVVARNLEAWKKDQQGRYTRIADYKCTLEIARLQKEKEVEVNAMREKKDPRMTERGSWEEEYNASLDQTRQLLHSVRQQQAYLQD